MITLSKTQLDELKRRCWSYSQLSRFKQCPYSYWRRYVKGDKYPSPNTSLGLALHDYAEKLANHDRVDPMHCFRAAGVYPRQKPEFDRGVDSLNAFVPAQVHPYRRLTEHKQYYYVGPFEFIIICDVILFIKDKVWVWDYKASSSADYADSHQFQFSIYQHFLETSYPDKNIKTQLYFPIPNKSVPLQHKPFTADELGAMVENVLGCQDFKPTPHKWCRTCEYQKRGCPFHEKKSL